MNVYAQTATAMPAPTGSILKGDSGGDGGSFYGAMQVANESSTANAPIDMERSSSAFQERAQTTPFTATALSLAQDASHALAGQVNGVLLDASARGIAQGSPQTRDGANTRSAKRRSRSEASETSGNKMSWKVDPRALAQTGADRMSAVPMPLHGASPLLARQAQMPLAVRAMDAFGSAGSHQAASSMYVAAATTAPSLGMNNAQQVTIGPDFPGRFSSQMGSDSKQTAIASEKTNEAQATATRSQQDGPLLQHPLPLPTAPDLRAAGLERRALPGSPMQARGSLASNGSPSESSKLRSTSIGSAEIAASHAVSAFADAGLRPVDLPRGALPMHPAGQQSGDAAGQDKSENASAIERSAAHTFQQMDAAAPWSITPLRAESRRLEVGVASAALGWVEVRATTDASGHVSASLHAQSDVTTQSLAGQLKEITNYVQGQSVAMSQVSVGVGAGSSSHREAHSEQPQPADVHATPVATSTAMAGDMTYDAPESLSLISVRA